MSDRHRRRTGATDQAKARRTASIIAEAPEVLLRHPEFADELHRTGAIVTVEGRTQFTDEAIAAIAEVLRIEEGLRVRLVARVEQWRRDKGTG